MTSDRARNLKSIEKIADTLLDAIRSMDDRDIDDLYEGLEPRRKAESVVSELAATAADGHISKGRKPPLHVVDALHGRPSKFGSGSRQAAHENPSVHPRGAPEPAAAVTVSASDWISGRGRILLYADEPMLARGLESVLRQTEGLELLPTCATLAGLMEQIRQASPDLVLTDLTPEITFAVLSEMKHAMANSRVVLWVNTISTELAFQAMGLGVRGILRKTLPTELQVKCLQRVLAGELWFEKALTDSFLCARRVPLTQREGQLVSLLSRGLKNKQIAEALMISEGTVKVHLARLIQKVGVKDRFELALFGLKNLTTGQLPVSEKGHHAGATAMPGLRSLVLDCPMERADSTFGCKTPIFSPTWIKPS